MSENPYESPRTEPLHVRRWPKYWVFTLVVTFLIGAACGTLASYSIGYIDGYQHGARKPLTVDDP
jgi:hypothetical protein